MLRYFGITPDGTVVETTAEDAPVKVEDLFDTETVRTVQVSFADGTHLRVEDDQS